VRSTPETDPLAASIVVLVLVLLAVWLQGPERSRARAILPGEEGERLREPDVELLYLLLSSILVAVALVSIALIAFYSSGSETLVGGVGPKARTASLAVHPPSMDSGNDLSFPRATSPPPPAPPVSRTLPHLRFAGRRGE
jgi:hypothetical protein